MSQDSMQEPVGAGAPIPAGDADVDNYEFSDVENMTVERAGNRARLWGIVSLVVAGLAGVGVLIAVIALLPVSMPIALGALAVLVPLVVVHLAMAMYYVKAGNSMLEVVRTSGNDVPHLARGIDSLANAFRIEVIVSVVAFAVGLIFAMTGAIALLAGGTP